MPSDKDDFPNRGVDSDKAAWQAEQARLDLEAERERVKSAKSKARKAKAAKRKVERLARELEKSGDITEWETEFTQSLSERLDKYDSAFRDPEKGGRGEALSYGQKAIVSQLKKKSKGGLKRSGFKPKAKQKFTPRVRQLDEDYNKDAPLEDPQPPPAQEPPVKGKPFLRLVETKPLKPKP